MQVWGSPTSPFVRKVRVFAIERGVGLDFVQEDPWQKSDRLLALNPLGKVPVLVLDDGRVVFDSLAIIEVLDDIGAPSGRMIPLAGEARWDAMKWHALAHGVIDAVVNRLLETRRPAPLQMVERMKREEERFDAALKDIESRIGQSVGASPETPSFAELMLGVAMRYADFRYPFDWRPSHPRLTDLVGRLAGRPSYTQTDPPT